MAPRQRGIPASTLILVLGLLIGGLVFAGTVSFHAAILYPPPPCTGCPPITDPSLIAYRNTIRTLGWVSVIAMDLAVSAAVAMAWIVGGSRAEIPEGTRRGIFIFATVFLTVWILFSFFAYTFFRALIPFG